MDTLQAFTMGAANRNQKTMVFDWHKAAKLIKENKPQTASAGLSGDWEWTGGNIFSDGKIITENYTYLASTWATPEIELDGHSLPCWVYQGENGEDWDSGTKWPESAKEILEKQ